MPYDRAYPRSGRLLRLESDLAADSRRAYLARATAFAVLVIVGLLVALAVVLAR